jgi:uncharacterized protein
MKNSFILLSLTMLLLIGCKEPSYDMVPEDNTPQQRLVLKNIGQHLIVPSYYNFTTDSDSLKSKCAAFCVSPTLNTLTDAQNAWKKAKLSWKQCEVFNFGPADSLFIAIVIDYPAINTAKIETNITTTTNIDQAFIESITSTAKGLVAIEYLLFDRTDNNIIINKYGNTATNYQNRISYLNQLCINLHSKANLIYNEWNPAGRNYLATFETKTGKSITSSLSLFVNSMIVMADNIKTVKLGIPLGKKIGTIAPSAVEAYYSSYSWPCIEANYKCLQYLMTGTGFGNMDGNGLNILLNDGGNKKIIYDAIVANLATDINYAQTISTPLDQAAQTNDASTSAFYDTATLLIALLKNDLSTSLNILVTFSDADGD